VFVIALAVWQALCRVNAFPPGTVPTPMESWGSLVDNFKSGQLTSDITASLFRVAVGFVLSVVTGVPFGLLLGQSPMLRAAFLPGVNFFRNLSPLAWIPFAILFFQIGDKAAIFLIFMATFFPIVLATLSAVSTIPAVRFHVGRDYGYNGWQMLTQVTFPAILPAVITSLRVTAGIAWVVVVAAEMVGCQDGLGYGIYEARNGQEMEMVVAYMVVIGLIGIAIDWTLSRLTKLPSVRWGYDQ
jgi:NitT/TauT family transport system permease protein